MNKRELLNEIKDIFTRIDKLEDSPEIADVQNRVGSLHSRILQEILNEELT